jgi:hypothetical protein
VGRYVSAAFLTVWLAGWALGETFALGFLIMLIRSVLASAAGVSLPVPGGDWIAGGAATAVFLFLVVWLTLWTFGGIAAATELFRNLAGEDLISVQPASLELIRRAGPFRRVRIFERPVIHRVRLRPHDKAVVIDTTTGTQVITTFGTDEERRDVTDWLKRQLSLPDDPSRVDTAAPPRGWTLTIEGGIARLSGIDPRARRIGAAIVWLLAGFAALAWFGSMRSGVEGTFPVVLTLLLMLCATWITWSRREWLVQSGQLTAHRRFATWQWERAFTSAQLEIDSHRDSDGDDRYELRVIDEQGRRTISSEINDDANVTDLGRWLSARTGFPLKLPHGMQPRRTSPVTDDELK